MTSTPFHWPLKFALAVTLASLPALWWAADRSDQIAHAGVAAVVGMMSIFTAGRLGRFEPLPGIDAARRAAARYALLTAMVYLWGSAAILISYYLTDLSWYHAYQYAIYLAIPGLISLDVLRRHRREATVEIIARELRTGRWMAWVQLIVMLGALVYMWFSREVALGMAGETANWAAVTIMLAGALALASISLLAIWDDGRLGRG